MILRIDIRWDEEGTVWVATSDDIRGLVLESDSLALLIERVKLAAPELLTLNSNEKEVIDMQKYTQEEINAVYDDDIFTITNMIPVVQPNDRQERKKEIEKTLYSVFRQYIPHQTKKQIWDNKEGIWKT